jgi:hypothetical protein
MGDPILEKEFVWRNAKRGDSQGERDMPILALCQHFAGLSVDNGD